MDGDELSVLVHVRGVMLLSHTAWQTSTGGGRGGRAVGS